MYAEEGIGVDGGWILVEAFLQTVDGQGREDMGMKGSFGIWKE